mmetsp:Transcript_75155/g.212423  ORF Transcript_75155/g.212423 Transcript_75155/m.212423 type:complete len:267 (-) Transcript_75155:940-1740(-)
MRSALRPSLLKQCAVAMLCIALAWASMSPNCLKSLSACSPAFRASFTILWFTGMFISTSRWHIAECTPASTCRAWASALSSPSSTTRSLASFAARIASVYMSFMRRTLQVTWSAVASSCTSPSSLKSCRAFAAARMASVGAWFAMCRLAIAMSAWASPSLSPSSRNCRCPATAGRRASVGPLIGLMKSARASMVDASSSLQPMFWKVARWSQEVFSAVAWSPVSMWMPVISWRDCTVPSGSFSSRYSASPCFADCRASGYFFWPMW